MDNIFRGDPWTYVYEDRNGNFEIREIWNLSNIYLFFLRNIQLSCEYFSSFFSFEK